MILVIVLAAIPIAALTFALGAASAFQQIGKGQFSVEFEHDLPQPVTRLGRRARPPRSARRRCARCSRPRPTASGQRGEAPIDVDGGARAAPGRGGGRRAAGDDPQLREEVRQLVVARNARRERQGEEPLDVEAEVERQLRELEGLGQ